MRSDLRVLRDYSIRLRDARSERPPLESRVPRRGLSSLQFPMDDSRRPTGSEHVGYSDESRFA